MFKRILIEQHEGNLEYVANEGGSILEKFLYKQMEAYFNTIFEDIRRERSPILLLSLVEPDILKQSNFLDNEIDIIKNIALEKLQTTQS